MLTTVIHEMIKPLAGVEPLCFPCFTLSLQLFYRIDHFQSKTKLLAGNAKMIGTNSRN